MLLARHQYAEQLDKIHVPVFSVGGWYDNFVESDLEAYAALRKEVGVNRILIGPWPHNMSLPVSSMDFGADSMCRSARCRWSGSTSG